MNSTEEAAAALTEATVHADFGRAQHAVKRFAELVAATAAELPRADALRKLDDACCLIEWSRRNLCAARAHVIERIRQVDSIHRYHESLAAAERAWSG